MVNDMKVLVVNETLNLGGAESISIEMANALAEEGIETYFSSSLGPLFERLNKGIVFYEIPKYKMLSTIQVINALEKIISKIQPDIIHSHGATVSVMSGIALKRSKVTAVNILTHHIKKFVRLPKWLSVYLLSKYCDRIIAISQSKFNALQQEGFSACKLALIPNFVHCDFINRYLNTHEKEKIFDQLNISQNNPVITTIGRLVPEKRIDQFIEIVALYANKMNIRVTGLVVGEGPTKQHLLKIAENYKNCVKIYFTGYQEDIFKYLAISNIFLSTSQYEVLPVGLIEATASGVPIVCSDIPGNNDIVKNGYNGFLVNGSKENYLDCIEKILNNHQLAREMSKNGKEVSKSRFDRKAVMDTIIAHYHQWKNDKKIP